jgi:hypothetical protein
MWGWFGMDLYHVFGASKREFGDLSLRSGSEIGFCCVKSTKKGIDFKGFSNRTDKLAYEVITKEIKRSYNEAGISPSLEDMDSFRAIGNFDMAVSFEPLISGVSHKGHQYRSFLVCMDDCQKDRFLDAINLPLRDLKNKIDSL